MFSVRGLPMLHFPLISCRFRTAAAFHCFPPNKTKACLVCHVAARVDAVLRELAAQDVSRAHGIDQRQNLRQRHLETLLNLLQHLLVLLAADERDRKTLGTETTSTADTVQVRVGVGRQVVVDGQVDTLDINTTTEDIGGDTDTLVELLELFVALDAVSILVVSL